MKGQATIRIESEIKDAVQRIKKQNKYQPETELTKVGKEGRGI